MAVRGVIFDVGGVLVESPFVAALRWRDELDLPDEILRIMFREYASIPEDGAERPRWHLVETGRLALDDFVLAVREQFVDHLDADHPAMQLRGPDFNVFRDAGAHWSMVHAVRAARTRGLVTAILTNNVREWSDWRDVIPVDEFDVVVDSCEVGLRKPDPAIWELTLTRMALPASEVVFLDDHPANVAAARELGMLGVVVGPDIDAAVVELEELLDR